QGSKCKGHGRKAATDYDGAETVEIPHECLKPGDACPKCERGKVYPLPEPKRLVRIAGHAPLTAVVYEVERLRCNLCGTCFTAMGVSASLRRTSPGRVSPPAGRLRGGPSDRRMPWICPTSPPPRSS